MGRGNTTELDLLAVISLNSSKKIDSKQALFKLFLCCVFKKYLAKEQAGDKMYPAKFQGKCYTDFMEYLCKAH